MDSKVKLAALWFVCAGLSGPVGILLHEWGHYAAAELAGLPDLKLSYASISFRNGEQFWQTLASGDRVAAAAIYPLHHPGTVAAAGPFATLQLIVASMLILWRSRPSNAIAAFLAGLALMAGVRALTGVYYILYVRPNYPDAKPFFDEMNVARAFDIPVDLIVWPSVAIVALAWIIVIPRLAPDRWIKVVAAILGPVAGILIWAQIGPFTLP